MRNGRSRIAAFAVAFLAFPATAWANLGSPLMLAGGLHLLFGNAVIGYLEGRLLAHFFVLPRSLAVVAMILANYASAWFGATILHGPLIRSLSLDLTNAWQWLWALVPITYLMTLFIEWPFVALCFWRTRPWLRPSLRGSAIVQSISYAVLLLFYWTFSGTSLYTQVRVAPAEDIALPQSLVVYFTSGSPGVLRRWTPGGGAEQVRDPAKYPDPPGDPQIGESYLVRELVDEIHSDWHFDVGFLAAEGLRGSKNSTGETLKLAFDTPLVTWGIRFATHLPSDKVLFQLGADQICVLDPDQRKIALLVRGRLPVAVIEDQGRGPP